MSKTSRTISCKNFRTVLRDILWLTCTSFQWQATCRIWHQGCKRQAKHILRTVWLRSSCAIQLLWQHMERSRLVSEFQSAKPTLVFFWICCRCKSCIRFRIPNVHSHPFNFHIYFVWGRSWRLPLLPRFMVNRWSGLRWSRFLATFQHCPTRQVYAGVQ